MSDTTRPAIIIDNLSRMYKRYRQPRHRVLDALGFKLGPNDYDEFWALRDVSLEVARGERVGLIGRNGAGKSTLLNIVCGRLMPSGGVVKVNGKVQALMELGTGFHPEFTGRQNVFASLAYQGVTGAQARGLLEEIIDFSELEEFIDQPVKTYSAGMYARLAFSTATAIEPDILIIDEILGAGDAYFAAKCTDRMRHLTEDTGATVLFVSHDIGSVQALCNRAVWIERGQVLMSGDTFSVSKSYYASIMRQEEERLRARTSHAIARMRRRSGEVAAEPEAEQQLLFRLITQSGAEPALHHPIRRIALTVEGGATLELHPGKPMDNDETQTSFIMSDRQYVIWSAPVEALGETVRSVAPTGGEYNHAPFCFKIAASAAALAMELDVEYLPQAAEPISVEFYDGTEYRRIGLLEPGVSESWAVRRFDIGGHAAQLPDPAPVSEPPGSSSPDESTAAANDFDPVGTVDGTERPAVPDPVRSVGIVETPTPNPPNAAAQPEPAEPESTAPDQELEPSLHCSRAGLASPLAQDRWGTAEGDFEYVETADALSNQPRSIFGCGETIAFRCGFALRTPLASAWLCAIIYDSRGNRIVLSANPLAGPLKAGKHEVRLIIEAPAMRQGDYVVTLEILPEFDYNWQGSGRLPYICHWDRSVFFRIDEQYHGSIELGLVKVATRLEVPARQQTGLARVSNAPRPRVLSR